MPGVFAVDLFRFGGEQMLDAEGVGDGAGYKSIRRGDDHQGIALVPMLVDQGPGLIANQRRYDLAHIVPMHRAQFRLIEARQWRQAEFEERQDIETAGLVVVIEALVDGFILTGIDNAVFAQVLAPQVVAVTGQQGIVEIKNR